ncbi:MAG: hypothetical protein AB4290_02050 [Spirulina sp.]
METRELIATPKSIEPSIREQLRQAIAEIPDESLEIALEFIIFLKSRSSSVSRSIPSTGATVLKALKNIGQWEGDDLEECLELVYQSRDRLSIETDDNSDREEEVN